MAASLSRLLCPIHSPGSVPLGSRAVESLRDGIPLLGESDHGAGIQDTKTEQVVELQTDAVALPLVVLVVELVLVGRKDGQVLNVTPGQLRAVVW